MQRWGSVHLPADPAALVDDNWIREFGEKIVVSVQVWRSFSRWFGCPLINSSEDVVGNLPFYWSSHLKMNWIIWQDSVKDWRILVEILCFFKDSSRDSSIFMVLFSKILWFLWDSSRDSLILERFLWRFFDSCEDSLILEGFLWRFFDSCGDSLILEGFLWRFFDSSWILLGILWFFKDSFRDSLILVRFF